MCNRARLRSEPETLFTRFGTSWLVPRPLDNRFNPVELAPRGRAWVIRANDRGRGFDVMNWDVLGGKARPVLATAGPSTTVFPSMPASIPASTVNQISAPV